MIKIEVTHSDLPMYLGTWQYEWNSITISGPKGLRFSSNTHPPIKISLYQKKYLICESEHFREVIFVQGRKVNFPFVVKNGEEIKNKYFTLVIQGFSESSYSNLENKYKELGDKLNLDSQEAKIIKTLLED